MEVRWSRKWTPEMLWIFYWASKLQSKYFSFLPLFALKDFLIFAFFLFIPSFNFSRLLPFFLLTSSVMKWRFVAGARDGETEHYIEAIITF